MKCVPICSPRRSSPSTKPLPCPSAPALFVPLLLSITLPIAYLLRPFAPPLAPLAPLAPLVSRLTPFPILTLSFGPMASSVDLSMLEHNCALITNTSAHRFIIYTDRPSPRLCAACECRRFTPVNCPCPSPGHTACNHCEKLHFLAARLRELPELLFLDSDLLILNHHFLSRLAPRAAATDALAASGHAKPNASKYYGHFNSGLLFMRRIKGLDYHEMVREMYKKKKNSDQGFVSDFIYRYYENWDTLSLKWHCRYLKRGGYDIPPRECYTLHDRKEGPAILKELNFTLRKLP